MNKGVILRILLIVSTILLSVVFFLPNTSMYQQMPDWWKKNHARQGHCPRT